MFGCPSFACQACKGYNCAGCIACRERPWPCQPTHYKRMLVPMLERVQPVCKQPTLSSIVTNIIAELVQDVHQRSTLPQLQEGSTPDHALAADTVQADTIQNHHSRVCYAGLLHSYLITTICGESRADSVRKRNYRTSTNYCTTVNFVPGSRSLMRAWTRMRGSEFSGPGPYLQLNRSACCQDPFIQLPYMRLFRPLTP